MKFTIICDESGTNSRYLIIGGLVIPRINYAFLLAELKELKQKLNLRWESELKWGKVSRSYLDKYKKLIEWFFNHLKSNHFRFRAHVIDTNKKEYSEYGNGDKEDSFYRVYFHLLMQCVKRLAIDEEGSNVLILLDDKKNKHPFRLSILKNALNSSLKRDLKLSGIVSNVEPRDSSGPKTEPLIQIVDILIGAIGYIRNGSDKLDGISSESKRDIIKFIENQLGAELKYDTHANAPFNIWTFDVEIPLKRRKEFKKKNRPII